MQNVNPWLEIAGMYANDPLYEEWQAAIEEYRDRVDRDIFGKTNNQSRRGTADDVDSHG